MSREEAEARLEEVSPAILRYVEQWLPIPQEWIDEYNELATRLQAT
jgi:hypothetical protein